MRAATVIVVVMLAGTVLPAQRNSPATLATLTSRAERTQYRETTRYDEIASFLTTVSAASNLVHATTFGYSFEGRPLELAVVGRVPDGSAASVKKTGRLRVFIQANVHAGEVDGKEAMLALIRDVARGQHADWFDSIVLLIAPDYNADGNERVSLTNRPLQHGPIGGMGTRANAQNLNINRDYIKLETPEARSMVRLLNEYDPEVMLDLHTTNGSRHAYQLTYEVPNNPAADSAIASLAHDQWIPAVARSLKTQYGYDIRGYGDPQGDGAERAWTTVEDLPRYSHNYWGLRNRFGFLSESYSYSTFEDRIAASRRFVEALLDYARDNRTRIRDAVNAADARTLAGSRVALRSRLKQSPEMVDILMGDVVEELNPFTGRTMLRRLDVRRVERMWEKASFEASDDERVPSVYYVPAMLGNVAERLQAHGIQVERLDAAETVRGEVFEIVSSTQAERPFENHRERSVNGRYINAEQTLPAGSWRVRTSQPLGRLAFYLLEPRSSDGLLTWNILDEALAAHPAVAPVIRSRD